MILTLFNVVFSVVLSKVAFGNLEGSQVSSYFGNATLLEAGFMLLYGSMIDYTSTERWTSTLKILKLSTGTNEDKKSEKTSFRENRNMDPNNIKKYNSKNKQNIEIKAITYVLCGAILLAEILILTLINI